MRKLKRLLNSNRNLLMQARDNAAAQLSLARIHALEASPRHLTDVGMQFYSQFDEDGILLYLFARIGTTNRKAVELCAGTGIECNTANLILNHRWHALLVDGNPKNIKKAKDFYGSRSETQHWPPAVRQAWLTAENVNDFVSSEGFSGDIDLLSLDVDGMDYWIWKALTVVRPRVVVLEFNHLLGPDIACTVPYKADFVASFTEYGADYSGASISAFVQLGKEKGYRFVGTNSICTNAFFVADDVPLERVPASAVAPWFDHPRAQFGMKVRYPKIKDKPWQLV